MTDTRPVCTAENPAPPNDNPHLYWMRWNTAYQHPDAKGECVNDVHDDWRYDCPHCKKNWIYEGPDA